EGKSTSAATATDPAIPAGDLLEGATEAWMPLWRIPLDGITVGKPVALFDILAPAADVWDSVSPTILYENASNTLKGPITLSEAPTNFARVTYFCKTDDGDRFSVEVPGSSPTFLASCCRWQGSTPAVFVKSRAYSVSGRTVDTYADVAGGATHYQSGMAAINTSTNT
ncbi:hypothetical protein, partial [Olsenella sp. HMSC062G07]|uniref:hypothetical protein n=1 Tax=Olsenella sp. HMSC062G07 TaxID=1739330 RepID=UPI00143AD223